MAKFSLVVSPGAPTGELVPFTAEEEVARDAEIKEWNDGAQTRAFFALREERNLKLAETDFYGVSDTPDMSDEMREYRSALRDLPAQYTTETILSEEITWPTKPD